MPQQVISLTNVLVTLSSDNFSVSQYRKSLDQKQEEKVVKNRVAVKIVTKRCKLGKTPKTT